jgi:hypothetical protein
MEGKADLRIAFFKAGYDLPQTQAELRWPLSSLGYPTFSHRHQARLSPVARPFDGLLGDALSVPNPSGERMA